MPAEEDAVVLFDEEEDGRFRCESGCKAELGLRCEDEEDGRCEDEAAALGLRWEDEWEV